MVKNSFRISDISINLNGSKNLLFKYYNKLKEEIVIKQDIDEKEEIAEIYSELEIEEYIIINLILKLII